MNASLKGVWPVAFAVGASACAATVTRAAFARTANGGWMWLWVLADLALLVALVAGLWFCVDRFRLRRANSVALAGVLGAALLLRLSAPHVGDYLHKRDFERFRPAMELAVLRLRALPDSQLKSLDPAQVVPEHPSRFYRVRAFRPTPDRFSVWFFYGGLALPPRHAAWLYDSDSTATGATVHAGYWHRGRKLRPHWFVASD